MSSDEDEPLLMRIARKKKAAEQWCDTSILFVDRAHKLRTRAMEIFEHEKRRVLDNTRVSEEAKRHLRPYRLVFDRGTSRRGVCNYPTSTRSATIGLSARMVDNGVPESKIVKVIRHELAHACNPGQRHNETWRRFDVLIGGDGDPVCTDREIAEIIGHRIEVVCPTDRAHYVKKMQKAPTRRWLQKYVCEHCKSKFAVFRV